MKIGVFGDSFADKNCHDIWWKYLEDYGHTVTCFGEAGSSILFSAKLILEHANNFDLCIWAITNPPRFSLKDDKGNNFHFTGTEHKKVLKSDVELIEKIKSADMYFKNLFDWEEADLVGTSLYHYLSTKTNLLALPCFYSPLRVNFNLYEVCEREAQYFFPNKDIVGIYKNYADTRDGHLCPNNQKILSRLINENLKPGIFEARYDDFEPPSVNINDAFTMI